MAHCRGYGQLQEILLSVRPLTSSAPKLPGYRMLSMHTNYRYYLDSMYLVQATSYKL
ncbi:hypothetical protein ACO0LM_20420 [Undibacterium sp. Di26W]|uniref:hypothetical protein n=1 Tax=Undibacterium sp. Di26W TaxID=3413035 RepID=UPI003BF13FA2